MRKLKRKEQKKRRLRVKVEKKKAPRRKKKPALKTIRRAKRAAVMLRARKTKSLKKLLMMTMVRLATLQLIKSALKRSLNVSLNTLSTTTDEDCLRNIRSSWQLCSA